MQGDSGHNERDSAPADIICAVFHNAHRRRARYASTVQSATGAKPAIQNPLAERRSAPIAAQSAHSEVEKPNRIFTAGRNQPDTQNSER